MTYKTDISSIRLGLINYIDEVTGCFVGFTSQSLPAISKTDDYPKKKKNKRRRRRIIILSCVQKNFNKNKFSCIMPTSLPTSNHIDHEIVVFKIVREVI